MIKKPFPNKTPPRNKLEKEERDELRRKKLCFNCKEACAPGHRCLGKGRIDYIEVVLDSEDKENIDPNQEQDPKTIGQVQEDPPRKGKKLTMTGTPHFNIFRVRGGVTRATSHCYDRQWCYT